MNNFVAKIIFESGIAIPCPHSIDNPTIEKDIIVALCDVESKFLGFKLKEKVESYYGSRNYKEYISKIIGKEEVHRIFCVSAKCIIDKIRHPETTIPDIEISPIWREERYGMSVEEAKDLFTFDAETNYQITKYKLKIRSLMEENLKIKVNKEKLELIRDLKELFRTSQEKLDYNQELYERDIANQVSNFINHNLDVESWVDNNFVFIKSSGDKIKDRAITEAFSIDDEKIGGFFDESSYDACVWPIISII
jgi:hypothetical protein